jgi:hypothetical protein
MKNFDRASENTSDSWFNWQPSLTELPELYGAEQQDDWFMN